MIVFDAQQLWLLSSLFRFLRCTLFAPSSSARTMFCSWSLTACASWQLSLACSIGACWLEPNADATALIHPVIARMGSCDA